MADNNEEILEDLQNDEVENAEEEPEAEAAGEDVSPHSLTHSPSQPNPTAYSTNRESRASPRFCLFLIIVQLTKSIG